MSDREKQASELNRTVEGLLPRLYNTAYYLAGDSHRAEDLVQETLAMFIESHRRNPSRVRHPLRWCLRVLARVSWKRPRLAECPIPDDLACDRPGPEEAVSDEELRRLVRASMQALSREERQVVSLRVFGELTLREVGREMGMPRSTAYDRLQTGLARLRRSLASVAGMVLVIPPEARGATGLVGWLRALPGAPVPSSLVQWSAALPAAASVAGTAVMAQTSGGFLMSALSTKTAWIGAGAAMVIGIVGVGVQLNDLRQKNQALEARLAASSDHGEMARTIAELRRSNEDLRRRLAAVEKERGADAAAETGAASTTAAARTPGPDDVDRLLAEAAEALNAHDRKRFAAAFLALIDAGDAAHAALMALVAGTGGSFNHIYHVLEGDDPDYAFRRELSHQITLRRKQLSGLLDAILSRKGEIDGATLFAFDLMSYNLVQSGRPREEQAMAVLDVLSTAIDTEPEGVEWNFYCVQAAQALGRLGSPEVLPDLEAMLSDADVSWRNKVAIAQAVAGIGGKAGVAILERIRDSAGDSLRELLLNNLAHHGGAEISGFLEESLAIEEDPNIREILVKAMAGRSRFREQLIEKLDAGELGESERMSVLESLFESENEADREKAWEHYERLGRENQDEVVEALAGKDARATAILFERLRQDSLSDELARGLLQLDARAVERHADPLRAAAGDPGASLHARGAAAGALSRVDPSAALSALLTGFEGLPDRERREVVGYLADYVRGAEARDALQRIAETDPAALVREAAEKAAQR
ncbi:MAG: sigma-70 family RNA polymerase sigma factor [Planctomycetes bacterium]|nr:sigma-70 family RNA polymerase sigma factor [Planctomycetota bacterium]